MRTLLKRSVAVFSNMIKSHSGFWSPLLIVSFCLISSLAHPVSTSRISSSFLSFILFHDFLEPMSLFLIYVFLTNTVHCLIYDNLFGELMEFSNYEHGLLSERLGLTLFPHYKLISLTVKQYSLPHQVVMKVQSFLRILV